MNWIKARAAELSTKLGLVLAAVVSAAQMFAPLKPEIAYAGFVASVLLVVIKEPPSASH